MEKRKRKSFIRGAIARVMSLVMTMVMVLGGMPSIPARAEGGCVPVYDFCRIG